MLKNTKKLAFNFKFLGLLIIPAFLFSNPILNNIKEAKAGMEFQWDQDSSYRRLKWFQKETRKNARNKIFFFFKTK